MPIRVNDTVDPRAEIVAYLRAHPSAADSLEGIIDWWLPQQRYETAKAVIQQALNDLAQQGIVEEVTLGLGVRLYRLARPSESRQ
jgi:hypothetical protein